MRWHEKTDFDPKDDRLPVPLEVINGLRSILREAVSNVMCHAQAHTVEVTIGLTPQLIKREVLDVSIVTVAAARSGSIAVPDGGNAIPDIVERAAALAGRDRVTPCGGGGEKGTRATVELPLDPDTGRARAAAE